MIDLSSLDPVGWPRVAVMPARGERVLHVHLSAPNEPQQSLCDALEHLGRREPQGYRRVDWPAYSDHDARDAAILSAAREIEPTLVWMQLQTPRIAREPMLRAVRALKAKEGVMVS